MEVIKIEKHILQYTGTEVDNLLEKVSSVDSEIASEEYVQSEIGKAMNTIPTSSEKIIAKYTNAECYNSEVTYNGNLTKGLYKLYIYHSPYYNYIYMLTNNSNKTVYCSYTGQGGTSPYHQTENNTGNKVFLPHGGTSKSDRSVIEAYIYFDGTQIFVTGLEHGTKIVCSFSAEFPSVTQWKGFTYKSSNNVITKAPLIKLTKID